MVQWFNLDEELIRSRAGASQSIVQCSRETDIKARVALAAIKGDRTLVELAEQFDVHPNQITSWKAQLEGGAADVFGLGNGAAQPAVDVKSLHAKIGELTLENDS
jgi:transposase